MNWRRGLLLAGIHLLIATSAFVQEDVGFWPSMRGANSQVKSVHVRLAAFQEQQVPGNSCDEGVYDVGPSGLANVIAMANLPVAIATGWHYPCMPKGQRARITIFIESQLGGNTRRAAVAAEACQGASIFVLWVLVGGFPLIRLGRPWIEPSLLITGCTILGALVAITRYVEFYRAFMLVLAILWLYWFFLFLWKPVRPAWQSTLRGLRRLSN